MDTKKLESLEYVPECDRCKGTKVDPELSSCKTHYVPDVPCSKCQSKPDMKITDIKIINQCSECGTVSGTHLPDCSQRVVTITAQHAASLAALVEHWKELLKYIKPIKDVDRGGLSSEYCVEMLEDLKG